MKLFKKLLNKRVLCKVSVWYLLCIIIVACRTGKINPDPDIIKNAWEKDSIDLVKHVNIDHSEVEKITDKIEFNDSVMNEAMEDMKETRDFLTTMESNNERFLMGDINRTVSEKSDDLQEIFESLEKNMQYLLLENKKIMDKLSVDALNHMEGEIVKEEYWIYREEHPKKDFDKNDDKIIKDRANKRMKEEIEKIRAEIKKNEIDFRLIVETENTKAYELFHLNSSIELSVMLCTITNQSYFETGLFKLDYDQRISFIEDFNIVLDTMFMRLNQAQKILKAESTNQVIQLEIYIDGYADTQGDKSSNIILSENRAKEIKNIFVETFENRIANNKNSTIKFNQIVFHVKGHGEEKPDLKIQFEPDNISDKNRRLVIMQCEIFSVN